MLWLPGNAPEMASDLHHLKDRPGITGVFAKEGGE